jgi:hypothetical protein
MNTYAASIYLLNANWECNRHNFANYHCEHLLNKATNIRGHTISTVLCATFNSNS